VLLLAQGSFGWRLKRRERQRGRLKRLKRQNRL
jgi:hypothetical protein